MSKKTYTPTYSAEFRERAIQLFKDHRAEYASDNKGYNGIAEKLGCSGDSLRSWCLQAARDAGQRPGPSSEEKARIKELEREVRELRQANKIFVDEPKLRTEFADVSDPAELREKAEALMRAEVMEYDQYLTGDVWCTRIEDLNRNTLDSCCGFFGNDYAIEEGRRMLADAAAAFRQQHGAAFAARVETETPELLPPA